jgi:hypothetical protein
MIHLASPPPQRSTSSYNILTRPKPHKPLTPHNIPIDIMTLMVFYRSIPSDCEFFLALEKVTVAAESLSRPHLPPPLPHEIVWDSSSSR